MRTRTRYLLLQIPGWMLTTIVCGVLWATGTVGGPVALGLVALWVVKDLAMYPIVRGAYEAGRGGSSGLVGERGVVRDALAPVGWVTVRGELWRAEPVGPGSAGDLPAGTDVRVEGVRGLVLLVARL